MEHFWYYLGCFLAVVVMESIPRFIFETLQPVMFLNRLLLLVMFLFAAWFFKKSLHERWKWSIVSGMFFVDAVVTVCLVMSLFLQFFNTWFVLASAILIVARAGIFSYLASDRMPHLKGLVFFTCFVFLVAGELVLTFGLQPF